jgi:hypothetical protein
MGMPHFKISRNEIEAITARIHLSVSSLVLPEKRLAESTVNIQKAFKAFSRAVAVHFPPRVQKINREIQSSLSQTRECRKAEREKLNG